MLSATALMSAVVNTMISPSKSSVRSCQAANTPLRNKPCFRYDPYSWRALSSPVKALISPSAQPKPLQPSVSPVPQENRLLYVAPPTAAAAPQQQQQVSADLPVEPKRSTPDVLCAPSSVPRFAFVQFKHDSATYLAPFKVSPGDYVFVEGDRGEDMGMVVEITTVKPCYPVPCKIIRRAQQREKDICFTTKRQKEETATKGCQQLADSLGLHLQIIDTEFQYDYNKLTVFFNAKQHHIDFRKLQRGLFREYRCRIWLTNMTELEHQKTLPRSR
jgi:hypothetical protein